MIEHRASGAAHVWIVPLDAPAGTIQDITSCLSAEERERSARFRDDSARRRYALARGALRRVLGYCAARDAAALDLRRGALGKPHLDGADALEFSLSHSRDIALIATAATAIGVDVEHQREPRHLARIAQRILHPDTVALLATMDGAELTGSFIDAWVLREAHVKAVGGGLFHTPDTLPFDPALPRDGTPRRITDRAGFEQWSVARFTPVPGTTAAIAARGPLGKLHIHGPGETLALLTGGDA
jgi:4'-phosphopantetheinyl transferase